MNCFSVYITFVFMILPQEKDDNAISLISSTN